MSGVRGFGWYGFSVESGLGCGSNAHDPSPYWMSRHPYDPQKVTDNTGDQKGDAVVFYQGSGTWYVAPSTGSNFGAYSQWITGDGVGSNRQLAADVNLDHRADSVVYFASDGSWWVSLSSGSRYLPYTRWIQGHGIGSSNQFLADVNQDGKADAVVYFQQTGSWYVALSTGSSFGAYSLWITGLGVGSSSQMLADATGDLRADAVVFFDASGSWYVAPANTAGTGFNPYALWITGHGVGSDHQFVADVNGDLKQDAVVFFGSTGSWYVALSAGSSFSAYSLWITGHGVGSDNQMLADATGPDPYATADAIVYFGQPGQGSWYVAPSTRSSFGSYSLWKTGFGIGS